MTAKPAPSGAVVVRSSVALRGTFGAIGALCVLLGIAAPLSIARRESFDVVAGSLLGTLLVAGGYWFLTRAAASVSVTAAGIQLTNPLWLSRRIPWSDVSQVSIEGDLPSEPVIRLTNGKRVKLYGAQGLSSGENSPARKLYEAVNATLLAADPPAE